MTIFQGNGMSDDKNEFNLFYWDLNLEFQMLVALREITTSE